MTDPHHLQRFIDAQNAVYNKVIDELTRGHKSSHWIWYIFPQIRGLGYSLTTRKYAIQSILEAKAYLENDILQTRLVECVGLVLTHTDKPIEHIMSYPDNLKFKSSMTLFSQASEFSRASNREVFRTALSQFFDGKPDGKTLKILSEISVN